MLVANWAINNAYSNPCLWVVTTLRHWKWGGSTSNTIGSLLYALKIFGENRQTSRWKREKVQVRCCVAKGAWRQKTTSFHLCIHLYRTSIRWVMLVCSIWDAAVLIYGPGFANHFLFSFYVYVGTDSEKFCGFLWDFVWVWRGRIFHEKVFLPPGYIPGCIEKEAWR